MAKKDYTKFTKANTENTEQIEVLESVENESTVENKTEQEPENAQVVEELKDESANQFSKTGTVKCAKLNVRKNPSTAADIAGVINYGTTLKINEALSTDEFYSIETEVSGKPIAGYCMKKFIEVS